MMDNITTYKRQFIVGSGAVDEGSHLCISSAMEMFQDMVTEQCENLGVSGFTLKDKCNAFWVVTKIKVIIDRLPFWGERIFLEAFPSKPTSRFCNWNCIAVDSDQEPLWHVKSEMCILDFEKQNIMRMKSTCFPIALNFREPLDINYDRINLPDDGQYIYTHQIHFSDIDMSHHTNNVKYNTIALNAFTCAEHADMKITDYQIEYISQSHEGDSIDIFRCSVENGWLVWGITPSDLKTIFAVKLSLK